MQTDLAFSIGLPAALIVIMLGLGLSLKLEDFIRVLSRPKAIIIGLVCQAVILPIFCFALVCLFELSPAIAVGMMLLAASPGGSSAALFTHLARGDVALSLTLAVTSSLVAIIGLPITVNLSLLHFYGEAGTVYLEGEKMAQIIGVAIVPAMIGIFIRQRYPDAALRLERLVKRLATLFLIVVVLSALVSQWSLVPVWGPTVGALALIFSGASLLTGFYVPRVFGIERRQAIALAMTIGIHNAALVIAVSLNKHMLDNPEMAIPPAIYGLVAYIAAGVFVGILGRSRKRVVSLATAA
jgi:bile acid:Na+ symporter, BASS family